MPDDQAAYLAKRFKAAFDKQIRKGKDRASLTLALGSAFGGTFLVAAFFKAAQDILAFVQPQLLNYLIDFVQVCWSCANLLQFSCPLSPLPLLLHQPLLTTTVAHSLTRSLTHTHTHTYSLTHSLTHSLTYTLTHARTH